MFLKNEKSILLLEFFEVIQIEYDFVKDLNDFYFIIKYQNFVDEYKLYSQDGRIFQNTYNISTSTKGLERFRYSQIEIYHSLFFRRLDKSIRLSYQFKLFSKHSLENEVLDILTIYWFQENSRFYISVSERSLLLLNVIGCIRNFEMNINEFKIFLEAINKKHECI